MNINHDTGLRDELLERLARLCLDLPTLDAQGHAELDVHHLHVQTLREALIQAFDQGRVFERKKNFWHRSSCAPSVNGG